MSQSPEIPLPYLSIVESIKDSVIVRDLKGKIIYTNKAAEDLFGYMQGELIGKDINIISPPFKTNEDKRIVESILWGENVESYETERIDKKGNIIFVSATTSALKDNEGKIIGLTKVIRDISENKKSEGKFQALLESAPDAMVIVNKFGQIVLVNAQTEKLFGYERVNLVGQDIERLVPMQFANSDPDYKNNFFEDPKIRELAAGLELNGIRQDGTQFPVEISLSPLNLDEGVFVSASIRDITIRKKSEAKFKGLLESAPDAMVIVNSEGNIQLINAQTESIFEYHREEIIGQKVEILIPSPYKGIHAAHRDGFFHQPRTRLMGAGLELFGRKKDGTEFPLEISLSPIETEEGLLVSAAIRDISSQKQAAIELKDYASRLESTNQELEQFAYVASHDLQEPLRNITNYAILLEETIKDKLDVESALYLNVITKSTERMKILISELLSFSRVGRNKAIEEVDCNIVLSEILNDMSFIIDKNKVKLTTENLPVINGNRVEIKQLIQNLIGNAIKFKRRNVDPEIEIRSIDKNKEWEFSFKDNGIGIKEDYLDKIFLVFQRLHSEEEYPGTGIGLATCKKIVESNEGKIWVDSEFGSGSTFYFTIPKINTNQ